MFGWLARLLGGKPKIPATDYATAVDPSLYHVEREDNEHLAGVSHCNDDGSSRQALIRRHVRAGMSLTARTEPNNRFDPGAVAVFARGHQIGYLPRGIGPYYGHWLTPGRTITLHVLQLWGGVPGKPTIGVEVKLRVCVLLTRQAEEAEAVVTRAAVRKQQAKERAHARYLEKKARAANASLGPS